MARGLDEFWDGKEAKSGNNGPAIRRTGVYALLRAGYQGLDGHQR